MAVINTILPFPYLLYEKSGWRGIPLDVLVVRGTFHLGSDGIPMHLATIQTPLQLGDNFDGPITDDPMGAVLKDDGDIVVGKMGTDIILSGHIYSPDAKPLKDWIAAVRIGALRKGLRVSGPRTFRRTLFGWKISRATPVTSVALDYRLAFGGRVQLPASGRGNDIHFGANPAGIGWLPTSADMKDLSWSEKRKVHAWCVFHANWTPVPPQTGQSFQRKLDTYSMPNWTPVPRQTGHHGRDGAGLRCGFTLDGTSLSNWPAFSAANLLSN